MANTSPKGKRAENKAVLGKQTVFVGDIKFDDILRIDGRYEGSIESAGVLYVETGAYVKADIKVRQAIVSGQVVGNIEATEKIEMLEGGEVLGNVQAPVLHVADGVKMKGKCDMIVDAESIDIFSAPVSQLKKAAVIV